MESSTLRISQGGLAALTSETRPDAGPRPGGTTVSQRQPEDQSHTACFSTAMSEEQF